MRWGHLVAVVVLAVGLCGCTWTKNQLSRMRQRWPWSEKPVPVTKPTEGSQAGEGKFRPAGEPTTAPSVQPVPVPAAGAAPGPRISEAPTIDEPTALTQLTPGAEPHGATRPPPPGAGSVVVAAAVLQVNNEFISVSEIVRSLHGPLSQLDRSLPEAAWRQRAMPLIRREISRQIHESLILAEAQSKLTDEQKKIIDQEMAETRRDLLRAADGSPAKLHKMLADEGQDLDRLLESQKRTLTVRLYLQSKFIPEITVTRDMLVDYYRKHPAEFSEDKQVQMQMIVAPVHKFLPADLASPSEARLAAARREAQKLIARAAADVAAGMDFGEAAKKYSGGIKQSRGGMWPLMPTGSFREKKVEEVAFTLPEGAVSDAIETEAGFYLVKAFKVRPGRIESFEEAQFRIREILWKQQRERLSEEYFARLLRGATILQSEKFTDLAVERAVAQYCRR